MDRDITITQHLLEGSTATFDVTTIEAQRPICTCLFSVGRGGNPNRHLSFLERLAKAGCSVIAPHFEMLAYPVPTANELDNRVSQLECSLNKLANSNLALMGVGHSIGTVMLLVLAGGKAMTLSGAPVVSKEHHRFDRLVLMAPPAGFFVDSASLSQVQSQVQIWAGGLDIVTPPSEATVLATRLAPSASVNVHVDDEANHFTFMDELPPQAMESHPNADAFRAALATDIGSFLTEGNDLLEKAGRAL